MRDHTSGHMTKMAVIPLDPS